MQTPLRLTLGCLRIGTWSKLMLLIGRGSMPKLPIDFRNLQILCQHLIMDKSYAA